MKMTYGLALAAALAFACSSGSKSTRTAGNDTGTTQSGSISGTQGTAAGANGAQGTATGATGTSNTPNSGSVSQTPADTNTPGSMSTQGTASSQQGTVSGAASPQTDTSTVGGTSGSSASGTVGGTSSSSTYGQGSVSGTTAPPSSASGTVAGSADNSNLRTVTGSVAKVDENSITLDQAAGGVTLTIDSQTQVIRRGKPAAGISSIREGEQVRASFDPASNRAEKIEVMGKAKMHRQQKAVGSDQRTPAPGDATGK
jgi:hypothetical protein